MLGYDVLLGYYGKIEQVAANIPATTVPVIQADGAWVTPGLFDMHSHAGVYSFPVDAQATQDGTKSRLPSLDLSNDADISSMMTSMFSLQRKRDDQPHIPRC
jgi:N-acetylglucosamine-6-phosphate deacetylase